MHMFNDSLDNWRVSLMTKYVIDDIIYKYYIIDFTFIKRFDTKIVLHHRCQSPRLVNKTPLQYTIPTCQSMLSVYAMHSIKLSEMCIERKDFSPRILVR